MSQHLLLSTRNVPVRRAGGLAPTVSTPQGDHGLPSPPRSSRRAWLASPGRASAPGLLVAACLFAGCAGVTRGGQTAIAEGVAARTGHTLPSDAVATPAPAARPGEAPPVAASAGVTTASLPPGIRLDRPLTADDAAAVALWNNAQLRADLATMGLAEADLLEASLLRNPRLDLLLPVGVKPFEMLVNLPVEAIWQRPRRVAAARETRDALAQRLVQTALDTARDARLAHADALLARDRAAVAVENETLRRRIAEITAARWRAGDISELETVATRADARLAEEQRVRFVRDEAIALARLRFALGLGLTKETLTLAGDPSTATSSAAAKDAVPALARDSQAPASSAAASAATAPAAAATAGASSVTTAAARSSAPADAPASAAAAAAAGADAAGRATVAAGEGAAADVDMTADAQALAALLERAFASRPDLRAAEMNVTAAARRAGWERSRRVTLAAQLSVKEIGTNGVKTGPGISLDLPIFNHNQGLVARADADVEVAARQYLALRHRVALDVAEAGEQARQARQALALLRESVLPALTRAVTLAEEQFGNGDVAYLVVLEQTRAVMDTRLRIADAEALVRRSAAQLERSVGSR